MSARAAVFFLFLKPLEKKERKKERKKKKKKISTFFLFWARSKKREEKRLIFFLFFQGINHLSSHALTCASISGVYSWNAFGSKKYSSWFDLFCAS